MRAHPHVAALTLATSALVTACTVSPGTPEATSGLAEGAGSDDTASCGVCDGPADGDADTGIDDASAGDDAASSAEDAGEGGSDGGGTTTGGDAGCDGTPLAAPIGQWAWVDVPGTSCGYGTPTGFAILDVEPSDGLLVFFMGGGGCFTETECAPGCNMQFQHCAANLAGYDETTFAQELAMMGPGSVLDRDDAHNPFRDHDVVVIPYCTGDFHSGTQQASYGVHHVGWDNFGLDLAHIVPTFCDTPHVVVMGASAGGWGATFNFARIADAFPNAQVDLVDDSGPPLGPESMALQSQMRASWGSSASAPAACDGCDESWSAFFPFIAQRYPSARISLVSALADHEIGPYFGGAIAEPAGFRAALDAFADSVVAPQPNARVFYVDEFHHVYSDGPLSGTWSMGVSLATFLQRQITGDPAWQSVRP
jgi:hypothetical protein